jgi:hypothetical protein
MSTSSELTDKEVEQLVKDAEPLGWLMGLEIRYLGWDMVKIISTEVPAINRRPIDRSVRIRSAHELNAEMYDFHRAIQSWLNLRTR